jgi:hypothetical protein
MGPHYLVFNEVHSDVSPEKRVPSQLPQPYQFCVESEKTSAFREKYGKESGVLGLQVDLHLGISVLVV